MLCLGMDCISKNGCSLSRRLKAAFQLNSDQVQRDLTFPHQSSQSLQRRSRELVGLSISGSCDPGSVWTHGWVYRLSPETNQPFSKPPESPGRGQTSLREDFQQGSCFYHLVGYNYGWKSGKLHILELRNRDRTLLSKLKCRQVHMHSNIILVHSVLTGSIFLT